MNKKLVLMICTIFLFSIMPIVSSWDSGLNSGLVSYWDFDEISGSLIDLTGYGNNNASVIDGTTILRGSFGKSVNSYTQTGADDLGILNPDNFNVSDKMSLAFWVYMTGGRPNGEIIRAPSSFLIYSTVTVIYPTIYETDGTEIQPACSVLPIDTWVHFVMVANGTDLVGYVNGTQTCSMAYDGTIRKMASALNLFQVSYTNYSMDEMGIWNRSLSDSEIISIYNSGAGNFYQAPSTTWDDTGLTSSLISYWNFNETSGSLLDTTGNGRNNASFINDSDIVRGVAGKSGTAYKRIGDTTQTVLPILPNGYSIQDTGILSISTWVYYDTSANWPNFAPIHFGNVFMYWTGAANGDFWFDMYQNGTGERGVEAFPDKHEVWQHLVMTLNGTQIVGYVDGTKIGQNNYDGTIGVQHSFEFMFRGWGANYSMDETALFNKGLSYSEVQQLYNDGHGVFYSGQQIIPLNITLTQISPANNTYSNNSNQTFQANITSIYGIKNVSFTITNATGGIVNQTNMTFIGTVFNYLLGIPLYLIEGAYDWIIKTYDISSNYIATDLLRITIDKSSPNVVSQNYSIVWQDNNNFEYKLNATITEQNLNQLGINFEGVNYTIYNIGGDVWEFNFTKNIAYVPYTSSYYFWAIDSADNYMRSNDYYLNVRCPSGFKIFNNSLCVEDLIYTGSEDKIRYLSIQQNNILTAFYFNLSGITIYPTNPSIKIGSTNAWSYSGSFNQANNKTSNLASIIYTYLTPSYLVGSNYIVPITFHSDTAGTLRYTDINWNYNGFIENYQTYSNSTIEGASEHFRINLFYNNNYYAGGITANLIYNGISYAGTQSGSGTNVTFLSTIIIPSVNATSSIPFYWSIKLINASASTEYYNSTFKSLNVTHFDFDDCSNYSYLVYNMTIYDEKAKTILIGNASNTTIEATLTLSSLGTFNQVFSKSKTWNNMNPAQLCGNVNFTAGNFSYRADLLASYKADGYVQEFYYIDNGVLSSSTNPNINFYDLIGPDSTSFLINYQDENYLYIGDAVIDVWRKYIGTGEFTSIEHGKTDAGGQTKVHLVTEDVIYKFLVWKNGVLQYTSPEYLALCQATPCQINLRKPFGEVAGQSIYQNMVYSLLYNETQRLVTFTFATTDGSPTTIWMNITETALDKTENHTLCSDTTTSSGGTLSCFLPTTFSNTTYVAQITKDGKYFGYKIFSLSPKSMDIFGSTGLILTALAFLTLALMGISSGIATIIFGIVGLVFVGLLSLFESGSILGIGSAIIWLIVAGIIIIFKISHRRVS